MNTIPIAFAFDNNLVMPACVCISSLMMHAGPETFYDIFILHSANMKLDRTELGKIPAHYPNCRIQYRTVDNTFDDAFEIRGITTAAYYRLLIPELIPEYDKIIYSDVDIIFRMDLSGLYAMDLSSHYLAACYDWGLNFSTDGKKYIDSVEGLVQGQYIQSGFIMFNSRRLRKDGMIDCFKTIARNKYRYQDQDTLNIACKGNVRILPFIYNMTDQAFYYVEKDRKEIPSQYLNADVSECQQRCNIHFNGFKPWKRLLREF